MPRDHYVALGIERDADLSQIRRAYRKASKRCHPDAVGDGTNPTGFFEIRNAFETLSDARKRRAYDAKLDRQRNSRLTTVEHCSGRRGPIRSGFEGIPSLMETFFGSVDREFPVPPPSFRSSPRNLYMEVVLSPEEAVRGGTFPVSLPVMDACPDCRRVGWPTERPCPRCLGAGTVQGTRGFNLTIPPKIRDGTVVEIRSGELGGMGVHLIVDVRIRDHPIG